MPQPVAPQVVSLASTRDIQPSLDAKRFIAVGTPGTGIATIAALTTLVDTSPFVLIQNGSNERDDAHDLVLEYVKLQCTAAGTAGASIRCAVKTDVARADRYTSGGSVLTINSLNQAVDEASPDRVFAGALVAAAAPLSRVLGSQLLRPVIPVVGDTYRIIFGGVDPSGTGLAPAGTAITDVVVGHPAVVIGPQQWVAIHIWLPSQSGASSYEVEVGFFKR